MSDEILARVEYQLERVLSVIGNLDAKVTNLDARVVNLDAKVVNLDVKVENLYAKVGNLETRMTNLENRTSDRIEVLEGTLLATMRSGFTAMRAAFNDLDVDLARNERKTEDTARLTRRLNRRLSYLEGLGDD
jgi:chromosome segregation ATPase